MRPLIPSPRQNTCSKAYEDHDAGARGLNLRLEALHGPELVGKGLAGYL